MTVTAHPATDNIISEVLEAIHNGDFDDCLTEIGDAAQQRARATRLVRTKDDYTVGDKVVFNDLCATKYLRGATATVTGLKRTKVTVQLDHPTGRFARYSNGEVVSSNVVVPVAIVDHITRSPRTS